MDHRNETRTTDGTREVGSFGVHALVKRYQQWLRVEIVIVCVVILVVWGLLMLPIVFYYLPLQAVNNNETIRNGTSGNDIYPCREDFFRENDSNVCVPTCPAWKQDPLAVSVTIDVAVFLSYSTGFVVSIIILILSVLRHKTMFSFPNILIIYMTLIYLIQNFFYIVTYFDRGALYCSSKNFLVAFFQATPFCIVSGMVQVYSTVSVAVWWLMLTAVLFWKIWFPYHARSFEADRKLKYVHAMCTIAGFLLPLVPIISLMSGFAGKVNHSNQEFIKGGMGFMNVRFPPQPCNGNDKDIVFYTVILPTNLMLAVGITLLILIFWLVHKQHGLFKAKQFKNPLKIGTAERKLLIVFCYYIVATVITLTAFADFAHKSSVFETALNNYFMCEQNGHDSANPCDRGKFEHILSRSLIILSYSFHGILPIVYLVFVVNIQELKRKCCQPFSKDGTITDVNTGTNNI